MNEQRTNEEVDILIAEFSNFMEKSYRFFKTKKGNISSNEYTKLEILRDDIDNFVTELTNFLEEQDDEND
jgi:hypothetical protein